MNRRTFAAVFGLIVLLPTVVAAQTSCPSLSVGSRGKVVSAVQRILHDAYENFPEPTGYFGPLTQAALKQWQKKKGIEPLGIVGPKTAAAMGLCGTAPSPAPASSASKVSVPDRTALIASLQAQLNALLAKLAELTKATGTQGAGALSGAGGSSGTTSSGGNSSGGGGATGDGDMKETSACSLSGQNVTHGSSVKAYRESVVQSGSSCVSEMRTCDRGALSGTYQYASCTVKTPDPEPRVACKDLFYSGFPMGGYGGDYYESGGNVVTVAEMRRDGWNLDGPSYRPKSDAYMNELVAHNICTIYTPSPAGIDNALYARIFDTGTFSQSDKSAFLEMVRSQVRHVRANPAWDGTIAGWYIPESNNETQAYFDLVRDARNVLREEDTYGRPLFSWSSRTAPLGLDGLLQYVDGLFIGHYLGFADNRAQYLFAADRVRQMKGQYPNKIFIVNPPMCQASSERWNEVCGPAFGRWTSAELQEFGGKFARHDVLALIASGLRGFIVFSFSDREGFANFDRYYGAYAQLTKLFANNKLDLVFSRGAVGDATASVLSGASSVEFNASWVAGSFTYPSVSVREWSYEGKNYALVVNSGTGPVTARLDNISDGVYVDLIRQTTVTSSGGQATVSITGLDAALYVEQ